MGMGSSVRGFNPDRLASVEELWADYKSTGSKQVWEILVLKYRPLVVNIAHHMILPMPSNVEEDDLISYGIFGLFDAIEKFDPSLGWKFETYARVRIKGAIVDGMRSSDWVPRSVKVRPKLVYVDGLEDGEEILLGDPFTMFEAEEMKRILSGLIDGLPEREREVLSLYYYDDLLLREVAAKFDRSEAWACLIHAKAIMRLRLSMI